MTGESVGGGRRCAYRTVLKLFISAYPRADGVSVRALLSFLSVDRRECVLLLRFGMNECISESAIFELAAVDDRPRRPDERRRRRNINGRSTSERQRQIVKDIISAYFVVVIAAIQKKE